MIKEEMEAKRQARRKTVEAEEKMRGVLGNPLRPWQTPSVVKAMNNKKKGSLKDCPHPKGNANKFWP